MENLATIEKFLSEEFELSPKEVKIYCTLLKYGSMTILELADSSGINRATTHVNVNSLTKKGFITQLKKGRGSRRIIMAEPLDKLSALLKQRKNQIELAEKELPHILEGLAHLAAPLKKENSHAMDIRYYRGKNEVKFIYEEALKAKEFRAFVNCEELAKVFPNNIPKFLEIHAKRKDMCMWEIMEDSPAVRDYIAQMPKERYFARLARKSINTAVIDYMIFDGKIAFVDPRNNITGIMIENENVYQCAKAIHEFVWEFLEPCKG